MEMIFEDYFPQLANHWQVGESQLKLHWDELRSDRQFLSDLNSVVRDVPEFMGACFKHVRDLRNYRCLLYLFTRVIQPEIFVETGVLNGFSSAFILLAMRHNRKGILYSIDLPPDDEILEQGNRPVPQGKSAGWVIPDSLRSSHHLLLGRAQTILPDLLEKQSSIDAFLHDSDHSYSHMMFELGLSWDYLRPGGWLLCDNVEANSAFSDFERGVDGNGLIVASFNTPTRIWKHGLLQKPLRAVDCDDHAGAAASVKGKKTTAEGAPGRLEQAAIRSGLPGGTGAVPARGSMPRAGGRAKRGPLT